MLVGSLDALISQTFFGWALDTSEPNIHVTLAFFLDGRLAGMTSASGFRKDLAEAGFGSGHYGFSQTIHTSGWNEIEIRSSHSGELLLRRNRKDLALPTSDTPNNLGLKLPVSWDSTDRSELSRVAESVCSPLGDVRGHALRYVSTLSKLSGNHWLKSPMSFKGGRSPIFMFCPINWDFRFQRYQHFALQLADLGFTVFYVGPGNLRSDLSETFAAKHLGHSRLFELDIFSEIGEVDLALPKVGVDDINKIHLNIRQAIEKIGGSGAIYISFPSWMLFLKEVNLPIIYDVADLHSGFGHVSAAALQHEDYLVKRADAVVCTTASLKDIVQPLRDDEVKVIPNAASSRFLYPLGESNDKKIKVGYVGAIDSWFDVQLLCSVATINPNLEFIIAGSGTSSKEISENKIPNIKLIGEIIYHDVAKLIDSFDVCFIPFKNCDLISHTDPVKMYEYMARGKPVISTPFASPERFGTGVQIIQSSDQFHDAFSKATVSRVSADVRQRFVKDGHTWLHRTRQLEQSINQLTNPITCWITGLGDDWDLWLNEAATSQRIKKIVFLFEPLAYAEFSHLIPYEMDGMQILSLPLSDSEDPHSSLQKADVKMKKFLLKVDAKKVSIQEFRKYLINNLG